MEKRNTRQTRNENYKVLNELISKKDEKVKLEMETTKYWMKVDYFIFGYALINIGFYGSYDSWSKWNNEYYFHSFYMYKKKALILGT